MQIRPSTSFALVLLDLKLPKVDGFEVLKQIKANPSTSALPVVILSSSKQVPDVDTSYELGANGYVQKPVNFDEFSDALRRVAEFWLGVNLAPGPELFKEEHRHKELGTKGVSVSAKPTEKRE